ncbi:MAG: helix-turn-helix transcriptional regulator [Alphaproteobacteria bacterium]
MSRRRLLTWAEVRRLTGLTNEEINHLSARKQFPSPIVCSVRGGGFDEDEIQDWLLKREEKRQQSELPV